MYIIKNLRLLFANIPKVTIDNVGSLKSWIREALHKQYWTQLVTSSKKMLLNLQKTARN
jgi:hypothetical protein